MTNAVDVAQYGSVSPSWRNKIINGNMVIDQRNSGASVTPTAGQYLTDRWFADLSAASKFTAQQNAGSVTPPVGFVNYLGMTSSSAYSVAAGDYFFVEQRVEGFNSADLGWGTANAQTVTLSFWVRSSLTGTFGGSLRNSANTRSYPYTYTISSANTWEQKSITIAGDTTGTWLTTNGIGIKINFGLGTGSTYSTTANAWASGNYFAPTGATSVVGTNGATFYITGVQLEAGSVATPFETRLYGTELALCQRYFELCTPIQASGRNSTSCNAGIQFLVTKRGTPSITGPYPSSVSMVGSSSVFTTSGTFTVSGDSSGSTQVMKLIVSAGTSWGLSAGVFYDTTFAPVPWCGASSEL